MALIVVFIIINSASCSVTHHNVKISANSDFSRSTALVVQGYYILLGRVRSSGIVGLQVTSSNNRFSDFSRRGSGSQNIFISATCTTRKKYDDDLHIHLFIVSSLEKYLISTHSECSLRFFYLSINQHNNWKGAKKFYLIVEQSNQIKYTLNKL